MSAVSRTRMSAVSGSVGCVTVHVTAVSLARRSAPAVSGRVRQCRPCLPCQTVPGSAAVPDSARLVRDTGHCLSLRVTAAHCRSLPITACHCGSLPCRSLTRRLPLCIKCAVFSQKLGETGDSSDVLFRGERPQSLILPPPVSVQISPFSTPLGRRNTTEDIPKCIIRELISVKKT